MNKVRVSGPIIGEVYNRELATREGEGMTVYAKIAEAPKRKDGGATVEVTERELKELSEEASYWADDFDNYTMSRGLWLAWRALARQCRQLG